MNARFEQRFVGINVAHPAQESLVQQQRLDSSVFLLQPLQEIVERDVQRVGAQRLDPLQQLRAPLNAPEMPNIVVNQQPLIQLENGPRVRTRLGIQQQLAGHAQVDR